MEPHGHQLGEGNPFAAGDPPGQGKVPGIQTQGHRLPGEAMGDKRFGLFEQSGRHLGFFPGGLLIPLPGFFFQGFDVFFRNKFLRPDRV